MSDEPLAERCYCLDAPMVSWAGYDWLATTLRWAFLREINLDVYDPVVVGTVTTDIACPLGISTQEDRLGGLPHPHAIFQIYGLSLEGLDED
jgi:hypothetical protein